MAARRFTRRLIAGVFCVLLLLMPAIPVGAAELNGRVVAISDGDTVTLLTPAKETFKIRLAGIDAPEKGQPFGKKSRQLLADLIFDKDVRVVQKDIDKYGRIVGAIYLGDEDINLLMVSRGGAWAYRRYLGPGDTVLIAAEDAARQNRLGLWALQDDQIMPPWEWRRMKR